MTAAVGRPQGAILLSSYQELDRFVRAFADGQLNLLFLLGRPGVQKSRIVQAAVGSRAGWIERKPQASCTSRIVGGSPACKRACTKRNTRSLECPVGPRFICAPGHG